MDGPNYQHPLALLLDRLLTPNEQGGYDLDATNAALLEAAILERADDPKLNGGLLALFGVADALHHRYGSLAAAGSLLAVLGRAGKTLFPIAHPRAAIGDLVEKVAAKRRDLGHLTGQDELTPRLNEAAPKGSVQAASFDEVRRARMGAPPSRAKPQRPG